MTDTAANVRVGLTGAVYVGATSETGPTDSTASWGTAFVALGYLSDDGVEEGYSDDTQDIKSWQGGTLVRRLITGSDATLHFTAIETSAAVLELFHKGSSLSGSAGARSIDVKAAEPDHRYFGLDVVDGDKVIRILVPDGEVTERGNIVYKGDEAVGYEMTVTAYPDSDGVVMTKMSADTAWGGS